jgi:hypothetical protein
MLLQRAPALILASGAPEEIRTPDPQIRSLVLYPAELRARFSRRRGFDGPCASENVIGRPAKARHSYRLRPGLARSGKQRLATDLCPRPLVAHAQELHRPVRNRDAEGRADGSFHQMNFPVMGANQFGGDRKP